MIITKSQILDIFNCMINCPDTEEIRGVGQRRFLQDQFVGLMADLSDEFIVYIEDE